MSVINTDSSWLSNLFTKKVSSNTTDLSQKLAALSQTAESVKPKNLGIQSDTLSLSQMVVDTGETVSQGTAVANTINFAYIAELLQGLATPTTSEAALKNLVSSGKLEGSLTDIGLEELGSQLNTKLSVTTATDKLKTMLTGGQIEADLSKLWTSGMGKVVDQKLGLTSGATKTALQNLLTAGKITSSDPLNMWTDGLDSLLYTPLGVTKGTVKTALDAMITAKEFDGNLYRLGAKALGEELNAETGSTTWVETLTKLVDEGKASATLLSDLLDIGVSSLGKKLDTALSLTSGTSKTQLNALLTANTIKGDLRPLWTQGLGKALDAEFLAANPSYTGNATTALNDLVTAGTIPSKPKDMWIDGFADLLNTALSVTTSKTALQELLTSGAISSNITDIGVSKVGEMLNTSMKRTDVDDALDALIDAGTIPADPSTLWTESLGTKLDTELATLISGYSGDAETALDNLVTAGMPSNLVEIGRQDLAEELNATLGTTKAAEILANLEANGYSLGDLKARGVETLGEELDTELSLTAGTGKTAVQNLVTANKITEDLSILWTEVLGKAIDTELAS